MSEDLRAAVAAGVLGSEVAYRSLLQSIVEVARAIFSARASSIFLLDEETDELVFEAVAGEGAEELVGTRLPSSTGIAGWTLVTRQPLVLDDVQKDPRFSREAAGRTGYVPKGLMAVPLLVEEQALGVLQVLDRPQRSRFSLQEMDLLGLFASQAAIALQLLRSARRALGP
jgi:GAF domain-containing protein